MPISYKEFVEALELVPDFRDRNEETKKEFEELLPGEKAFQEQRLHHLPSRWKGREFKNSIFPLIPTPFKKNSGKEKI